MTKEHSPVSREEEIARPLGRALPQPEGLQTWEEVISLFRRHGLDAPPVRLRDELVGFIAWARYGERLHDSLAALSPVEGLGCRCSRWYSMACAPMNGTAILIRRQTEFESEEGYHVVRWDDGAWQVHDGKFDYALRGDEPQGWQHLPALSEATTDTGDRGRHLAKAALEKPVATSFIYALLGASTPEEAAKVWSQNPEALEAARRWFVTAECACPDDLGPFRCRVDGLVHRGRGGPGA